MEASEGTWSSSGGIPWSSPSTSISLALSSTCSSSSFARDVLERLRSNGAAFCRVREPALPRPLEDFPITDPTLEGLSRTKVREVNNPSWAFFARPCRGPKSARSDSSPDSSSLSSTAASAILEIRLAARKRGFDCDSGTEDKSESSAAERDLDFERDLPVPETFPFSFALGRPLRFSSAVLMLIVKSSYLLGGLPSTIDGGFSTSLAFSFVLVFVRVRVGFVSGSVLALSSSSASDGAAARPLPLLDFAVLVAGFFVDFLDALVGLTLSEGSSSSSNSSLGTSSSIMTGGLVDFLRFAVEDATLSSELVTKNI